MKRKKKCTISIPSRIMIGESEYRVLWCHDLTDGISGLCTVGEPRVIVLNSRQDKDEYLPTLMHEILHAIEHEYRVKLGHGKIRRLEYALAQVFAQLLPKR